MTNTDYSYLAARMTDHLEARHAVLDTKRLDLMEKLIEIAEEDKAIKAELERRAKCDETTVHPRCSAACPMPMMVDKEAAELADWFTGRYLKGQHVKAVIDGRERAGVIALNSPPLGPVNVRYTEATTGQVKVVRVDRKHVTPIN